VARSGRLIDKTLGIHESCVKDWVYIFTSSGNYDCEIVRHDQMTLVIQLGVSPIPAYIIHSLLTDPSRSPRTLTANQQNTNNSSDSVRGPQRDNARSNPLPAPLFLASHSTRIRNCRSPVAQARRGTAQTAEWQDKRLRMAVYKFTEGRL
jgi:hypothetical protein